MALQELNQATTTDFTNLVPNFIVESMALDVANADGTETFVYFDKAPENFGYYFNHPQVASPLNALCTWAFGQGYTTPDKEMEVILPKIDGNGKETFNSIIWNHENVKLSNGDSFIEIIRNKKGTLVNLINISPERVKVVFVGSRIKRYEIWNGSKWVRKKTNEIFHSFNKKIGDSNKGTSQVQANKNVNDAMIEAFEDERVIKHRDKALGIVYYKTSNAGKILFANEQIAKAVKNGEMVGLPEDTAEILPYPSKSSEDRQNWLQYVENLGYQTGGVPRSIATSDGTSEVGGINGHLIFEPIYGKEQLDMENELWQQVAIKIKFTRPPSLAPKTEENAEKNTGQTSIQPAEAEPKLNR
ncbi:MAG TPA: hypothetical protein ENI23_16600 [bacterium]|nr:hypothetical protein [bacterium]